MIGKRRLLNTGKLFIPVILLLFTCQFAYAQQTITGTVTSAENGDALPGVTVRLKADPTKGTITNQNGMYRLDVPSSGTLVFSSIGYITREMAVGSQRTINVVLTQSLESLEEVVVIGYGVQRKEDATGSVSTVGVDDFNPGAINSPQELLVGKTSGVQITNSGGAPGAASTIRIRGGSSMSAINDPLIVVDGLPLDNGGVSGMRNPLNTINPNDIETFTILKDASATAIYGSRASNGVIIITTKKAKLGSPLQVSYTGKVSIGTIGKKTDVLDADAYRTLVQERYADNANALGLLGESNTNWQDEIFNSAIGHEHNLSATGSVKNLPYRVSVGYNNSKGILKTSELDRMTGSVALNPSFFDNHLKVNINAKGMTIDNRFANQGAIGSAINFDPTQSVNSDSDMYGGYTTWVQPNGNPITIATMNPLAMAEMREDISDVKRFIGNAQFDYQFHFLPELRANLNIATDISESKGTVTVPDYAPMNYLTDEDGSLIGGINRAYDQKRKNELLDFYLNYTKDLSSIDSRLEVMAGYSWQHFWRQGSTVETNTSKTRTYQDTDYETENYLVSFFGRINYSLSNKYLLTLTLRNDGSSRFSPDTRWGLFPSAAFAWKIKEESFLKNVDLVSDLKLRLGYGVTGQQNLASGDYPYLARYTYSESTAEYQLGNAFIQTLRPEGYDANLKWEETTTINVGLDYGFLDNRIIGSLEYYSRETKDLINVIPVPAGTNLTNRILTNVGNLTNKGVEFSITGRPVVKEDFFWEVGANVTYNVNEITKLTATDDPTYIGVEVGGISGGVGNNIQIHSVGHPAFSYYVYEQVYDTDGKPIEGLYVDRNEDGMITADDKYHLNKPYSDVFFGFSSRLNYKNWNFSFSGRANLGNYNYNNNYSTRGVYTELYNSVGYLMNVSPNALFTQFNNPKYFSDYYIQEASFLRLDNVNLGYQFNDILNKDIDLHLSLTVQNALVLTKYEGLDPEVFGGVDNNIYPRPRIIMLGLKLDF